MKLKRIAAFALAVLLLASLAACSLDGPKGSVYWLNAKPELDESLQSIAKRYQEEKGVEVRIVTPAAGDYELTLRDEMDSDDPPSIFMLHNTDDMEEWGSYAYDLWNTGAYKSQTVGKYNLVDQEGKVVAIPFSLDFFGIAVNTALIGKAGYSVDEIKSFQTLKEAAESIHANADTLGFDAFCSPDLDDTSSWRITAMLVDLVYYYEARENRGWPEAPPSLSGKYVPNFRKLYDLCINNAVSAPGELAEGGHHPEQEFSSGKAAFFLTGSWDYAELSKSVPDMTMIPYYCGVKGEDNAGLCLGSQSFWAVNVNISGADRKATLDFMNWLVNDPEASAAAAEQVGNLPYKKAKKTADSFMNLPEKCTADGHYMMDWESRLQPDKYTYRADLTAALSAYNVNRSDQSWEQVKEAIVDNWAKLYVEVYNQ